MSLELEARLNALLADLGPFLAAAARRVRPRGLGIPVEDIVQEVRIRLWRALEHEREIREPASYLYRVAATAAIDAVRRAKARREDPLEAVSESVVEGRPAASPEALARSSEVAAKVDEALRSLPEERRRAVALHLQGFGAQEVAELLGWTEPKARNLIYRGLADLREGLRSSGLDAGTVRSR